MAPFLSGPLDEEVRVDHRFARTELPRPGRGASAVKQGRRQNMKLRRNAVSLVAALLLHGSLSALHLSQRREARAPLRSHEVHELDVGLWDRDEAERAAPPAPPRPHQAESNEAFRALQSSRRVTPTVPFSEPQLGALPATDEGEGAESPAAPQDAPNPGAARPVDLGLGTNAWTRWVKDLPAPDRAAGRRRLPLVRTQPASSTGGLQEGLEARDRELGLSPAGAVVSALYAAALSDSPRASEASFAVTILRAGTVEVTLVHAAASHAEWHSVARRAAESLRKKLPRLPATRNGVRVVLKLVTDDVLPGGNKAEERGGLSGLLPPLDPVNIGAKAQKIIRTRVQEETMF
jgi:hypothetical protein